MVILAEMMSHPYISIGITPHWDMSLKTINVYKSSGNVYACPNSKAMSKGYVQRAQNVASLQLSQSKYC